MGALANFGTRVIGLSFYTDFFFDTVDGLPQLCSSWSESKQIQHKKDNNLGLITHESINDIKDSFSRH